MKGNGKMTKKGFTLIEVVLFLAISAAIFAAVMTGTSATVGKRRYKDSVDGVVEEIKNAYSAAINVENYRRSTEDSSFFCSITSAFSGHSVVKNSSTHDSKTKTDNNPGRTRCAYYGQVITFGENNDTKVHRYDLIGLALENNIEPEGDDDVLHAIGSNDAVINTSTEETKNNKSAKVNIVTMKNLDDSGYNCSASLAGNTYSYTPGWEARIENKNDRNLYKGAIMIVRSPISGTIHTYFYSRRGQSFDYNSNGTTVKDNNDDFFNVQAWLSSTASGNCGGFYRNTGYFVDRAIREGKMVKNANLEFCIGSEDLYAVGNRRRAIRIHGDGSNEAAVELLTESESAVACRT